MNAEQKKKAMERLKKLLMLSRSTNENEAAAALGKAQELMRELSVSEDDLELTDYTALEADGLLVRPGRSVPVYVMRLEGLIEKAFGCTAVWDRHQVKCKIIWLGQKSKAEISAYSWTVLARLLKNKREQYKFTHLLTGHTPGKREALADTFCEGWVAGVSRNILQDTVSAKDKRLLDLFLNQKFPNLIDLQSRGAGLTSGQVNSAYTDGIRAGQKTHLHSGVQNTKRGQVGQTQYLGAA
ncbi:MAG: DUF2786 domain-containing protein [Acetobacter orientalis]|uniref:DUF2786 domain-containing protein n=1 Tax=Acetobacter orientalis TaxID=146474 RepID=UPI0039EB6218